MTTAHATDNRTLDHFAAVAFWIKIAIVIVIQFLRKAETTWMQTRTFDFSIRKTYVQRLKPTVLAVRLLVGHKLHPVSHFTRLSQTNWTVHTVFTYCLLLGEYQNVQEIQ